MKKRILCAILALVMTLSMGMPALAAGNTYHDVPDTHWAAQSIERAAQLGIFHGVNSTTFGLGQAISRAAFVTALVRLFGWETVESEHGTFHDVAPGTWYYAAVETAVKNGAIAASGKNFRPNDPLSRSDMASMIIRALGYTSLAGLVSGYDCSFSDVTANKGFITMAYDMGIVGGVGDGKFDPNASATREQAAAILVRVYDKLMAASVEVESEEGYVELRIKTPAAQSYNEALRDLKESGQDMSRVVLCLTAGGVRTVQTNQGWTISTSIVDEEEMTRILGQYGLRLYYSERYESAYCVYSPNIYQSATVWYQSERSLAVKLQLARLFGVTNYMLV
mgnify:CR=1 FL=1